MQTFRVRAEGGRQHLDRDVSPKPRITGAINFAHTSTAKGGEDVVRAEMRAG